MMSTFQSLGQYLLPAQAMPENNTFAPTEAAFVGMKTHTGNEPYTVECIKDEGIVKKIRITCSCGRELYLECEYKKNKP